MMKNYLLLIVAFLTCSSLIAQIKVDKSPQGMTLMVDGQPFMVNGVNWDYVPIGTTITDPGIWAKGDDIIKAAIDGEMSLLKNMGVNAIRTYNLPPKWIQYIYENYGIYTMLNITFGAYGLTLNGAWTPQTDYSDELTREVLMNEARDMANTYKGTPGLLIYMIGNENNYHLSWTGAETEDIPIKDKSEGILLAARALYKAINDATLEVKKIDNTVPVAICNGDLLYADIVAEECTAVDIYGTNMYRGQSFGDAFTRVRDELNMPILFAEFGSDAFNARDNKEDQYMQAFYDVKNWQEIYANAAGLGLAGNSIGGFTFQFSDGWWKYAQTKNLDVHDNTASWANGGYAMDQAKEGDNNMNEEWFGIAAKGPTSPSGLYQLYPRAAYYALQDAHEFNPYASGVTLEDVNKYFSSINIMGAVLQARGDKAAFEAAHGGKIRLTNMRAEFTTFSTGGDLLTTKDGLVPDENSFPNGTGFDHMQSYFVGVEGRPANNVRAEVNFNILGNIAENPINEIFYENVGRATTVQTPQGPAVVNDPERLRVYSAEIEWQTKLADVKGFYRTGHYHWGYEGDFFGLYPEANYGPNLDIYNGEISGLEFDGRGALKNFKAAFGDQLWWGANPAFLVNYGTTVAGFDVTGVYHEDIGQRVGAQTSGVIPLPKTRRATVHVKKEVKKWGLEGGVIWAGEPLNGRVFQNIGTDANGNEVVFNDKITSDDNWGGKAKITYTGGKFNWYALGASTGLVANGGADQTQTFTGWTLKDNGSGNQNSFLTGFTFSIGDFQIAPNFLYQKPLVDPMRTDVGGPARLRNILDDPFSVRWNREMTAGEMLITYDPTPGTWYYAWDNDRAENAKFAFNLNFIYRHQPTSMDAFIGFNAMRQAFAFPEAVPAEDLWELKSRIVSKVNANFGLVANLYGGTAQANGDSERLLHRYGGDLRMIYKKWKLISHVRIDDWGPFDYHRDFNLTYPLQLGLDLSVTAGNPDWFILPGTQLGAAVTWRSLNEHSPRFSPAYVPPGTFPPVPELDPTGFPNGQEWEIRSYLRINIGK